MMATRVASRRQVVHTSVARRAVGTLAARRALAWPARAVGPARRGLSQAAAPRGDEAAARAAADELVDESRLRNFSIIAHVDHGKSTLADRLLERTGTISGSAMREQVLDTLDVERERGITVKLQSARMEYTARDGQPYVLNLIDTPGHVDFSYEVSRALLACEGALLVVDASQGVQAQTVANVQLALRHNLEIVPVFNKVDLPTADVARTAADVEGTLAIDCADALHCSAKLGHGIDDVLEAIVTRVPPPPPGGRARPLRALIFDSHYDSYKGVVAFLRVVDGELRARDALRFINSGTEYDATEVGVMSPGPTPVAALRAGEVGFVCGAIKHLTHARVGDTVTLARHAAEVEALPGYAEPQAMVHCGLFPADAARFEALRDGLGRLSLNDAALRWAPDSSDALGAGFRCGFLGLLHMEVVQERLEREHGLELIVTSPSVGYRVRLKPGVQPAAELAGTGAVLPEGCDPTLPSAQPSAQPCTGTVPPEGRDVRSGGSSAADQPDEGGGGAVVLITSPDRFPEVGSIEAVYEPFVGAEMLAPFEYAGALMELCQESRGAFVDMQPAAEGRTLLRYELPLAEVFTDFFDRVKSRTRGYASLEYKLAGYRRAHLVKLDVLVNGERAGPLSMIVHREEAERLGRKLTARLKELIPRQQFKVPIQAAIGAKVIAAAHIAPYRKDVTAKCYGGDVSRQKKLLLKQAAGKKRMKTFGKVSVPQSAMLACLTLNTAE